MTFALGFYQLFILSLPVGGKLRRKLQQSGHDRVHLSVVQSIQTDIFLCIRSLKNIDTQNSAQGVRCTDYSKRRQ
jgi:hypothetical protein